MNCEAVLSKHKKIESTGMGLGVGGGKISRKNQKKY